MRSPGPANGLGRSLPQLGRGSGGRTPHGRLLRRCPLRTAHPRAGPGLDGVHRRGHAAGGYLGRLQPAAGPQGGRAAGGIAAQPPGDARPGASLRRALRGLARYPRPRRRPAPPGLTVFGKGDTMTAAVSGSPFAVAGRVAVVTGGYGVLGGAIAAGLARAGAAVAILGRRPEAAEAKAAAIRRNDGDAFTLIADVLDEGQLRGARDQLLQARGRADT